MTAKTSAWSMLVGLLALVACARTPVMNATPSPLPPPAIVPSTATPAPVDAAQIAALGYGTCPYANQSEAGQIGFRDIYPGVTTSDELFVRHGEPEEYQALISGEPGLLWLYPTLLKASITVQSTVVTRIDHQHVDPSVSVTDIVEKFGCPDLILSHDVSPHATGDGFIAYLVYAQRGASYLTQHFPTHLADVIEYDVYFVPTSPVAYVIDQYGEVLPDYVEIVAWEDAIKGRIFARD